MEREKNLSRTSYGIFGQIVAQLTVNLIDLATNDVGIEHTDHQIAFKSSTRLFSGWNLHPAVSSIKLQKDGIIEHAVREIVLAHGGLLEQVVAVPEDPEQKDPEPIPRPPETSHPKDPLPLQLLKPGPPDAKGAERSGEYAALKPS